MQSQRCLRRTPFLPDCASLRPSASRPPSRAVSPKAGGKKRGANPETVSPSGESEYAGTQRNNTRRQGRSAADSTSRYPSRNQWGVGGWAGGEKGLQQFLEETKDSANGAARQAKPAKAGKAKSSSAKRDGADTFNDTRKYPSKDSYGPLSGLAGGFAGGERGLQQFVEEGDIKIAERPARQFSPLLLAGGVAGAAVLGGLALNGGVELGEAELRGGLPGVNLAATPLDASTKLALQAAVVLMGLTAGVAGVRGLLKVVQDGTSRLAERALDVGKVVVFWVAVFLAAKFVLASS